MLRAGRGTSILVTLFTHFPPFPGISLSSLAISPLQAAEESDDDIKPLLDMGFDRAAARKAFVEAKGSVDKAVALLTA